MADYNFLRKLDGEDLHSRERQIIADLCLGTFDPNNIIGADFLAIRNFETIRAMKDSWIKERRKDYTGKDGWNTLIRVWAMMRLDMFPCLTKKEREREIKRQEHLIEDRKEGK